MSLITHFKCAWLSSTGRVRENNEDRVWADAERGIFAVVDGMGGHAAGEEASETAVRVLSARLGRETGDTEARIREAITLANNEIHRRAGNNEDWGGMACVLTVAVVEGERAHVGHVGDTRLYLVTPSGIAKVTRDHSPVGVLEDAGALTEAEAMSHPRRNEVFRDVGSAARDPDDEDFIDALDVPFTPDSALLLCSDGLSDMLTSSEIRSVVVRHAGDEGRVVEALIAAANAAGGRDNVSAVYVEGADFARAVREPTHAPAPPDNTFEPERRPDPAADAAPSPRAARTWPQPGVSLLLLLAGLALGAALMAAWHRWAGPADRSLDAGQQPASRPAATPVTHRVGAGERFGSIGEALGAAAPGDTVSVAPGEYREALVVSEEGVSLVSAVPHAAVLRPPQGTAAGGEEPPAVIRVEGVRTGLIYGFRILLDESAGPSYGLRMKDAGVRVEGLEVSGAASAGVELSGNTDAVLAANYIHDNAGPGVFIGGGATPLLLSNRVSRNGLRPSGHAAGVIVDGAALPTLRWNTIEGNGVPGISSADGGAAVNMSADNFLPAPPAAPRRR